MFDPDHDVFANLGRIIETQDAILLGHKTYDYWVDYWPTSDFEPLASFINNTTKRASRASEPRTRRSAQLAWGARSPAVG